MDEKRRATRLKEEIEITITIVSGGGNSPKEKVLYNYSKDISASGARIMANILLPVDTILRVDFQLKSLQQKITALGKVKWIKILFNDEFYEAGVEFVNTPGEAIHKIADYISWKQNPKGLEVVDEETNTIDLNNMEKCPYCFREIEFDAVKCDYCGRKLNQQPAKRVIL